MVAAMIAGTLLAAWVVVAYNRLVRDANRVREAWSGIDVQLKRRHDLVPNLVAVVQAYAGHEKGVLTEVTAARTSASSEGLPADLQRHENALSGRLRSLLAVAEAYPQLLADRSFADLHDQLVEIEDQLQMARRYFNGTVRDYNIRVESVPSNLVARLLGFELRSFFELASATERHAPEVRMTA